MKIICAVLVIAWTTVAPFTPGQLTPVLAAQSISFQRLFPAAAVDNGKQRVDVREVARMVDSQSPLYDILANSAFRGAAGGGEEEEEEEQPQMRLQFSARERQQEEQQGDYGDDDDDTIVLDGSGDDDDDDSDGEDFYA